MLAFSTGMSSLTVPPITFYTHTACPFAQRVAIALEATGLPFSKVEVCTCASRSARRGYGTHGVTHLI